MSNDPMRLRRHADLPMLLASGSKTGGSAKTSVLLATASLAPLAGLRIGIIDADATGTSAISYRVERPDVQVIPLIEGTQVSALFDQCAAFDLVLFDVGANELTSERTFVPLIRLVALAHRLHVEVRHPTATGLSATPPDRAGSVEVDADRCGERIRFATIW